MIDTEDIIDIKVGESYTNEYDFSDNDFTVTRVRSDCNCLTVLQTGNIVSFTFTAKPFPLHLEYKDEYVTTSNMVLFTSEGIKRIPIKFKIHK